MAETQTKERYQMEPGEFHETNGWYFKRLPDGGVRIRVAKWPEGTVEEHVLAPFSWCSVIAHVSRDGESAYSFSSAETFHAGLGF